MREPLEDHVQIQVDRAIREAQKALGWTMRIVTEETRTKRTVTNGKISKVEFGRLNGRRIIFKTTLECGVNKTPRVFFLSRLRDVNTGRIFE